MSILDRAKAAGARQVLAYIEKDPDKNILRIVDWMIKFNVAGSKHNEDLLKVRAQLEDRDSSWYRLVKSLWTEIDTGIRKTVFENLVVNVGMARQSSKKKSDVDIPMGIMLDQTGVTEIRRLPPADALTFEEYDMHVRRRKRAGTFAFIFTGGTESISVTDLRKLARVHSDCIFVMMCSAEDVDDHFADTCFAVRNIVPVISAEGCEGACVILRRRRLAYGVFTKCGKGNLEELKSEEFADRMVSCGAKIVWMFTDEEDSLEPEQEDALYAKVLEYRNEKPVLIVDFISEEQFLGGRIEGR